MVDYSRYPARETQVQWLRYYLEAQKGTAASPREVERLYAQVNKFALVSAGTQHSLPPRAQGQLFLVRASTAVLIHHDQSNLGGKGFILPYSLKSVIQGSQGGNLAAGTDVEARRNAVYWLAPHGLFSLLSHATQGLQPRE